MQSTVKSECVSVKCEMQQYYLVYASLKSGESKCEECTVGTRRKGRGGAVQMSKGKRGYAGLKENI